MMPFGSSACLICLVTQIPASPTISVKKISLARSNSVFASASPSQGHGTPSHPHRELFALLELTLVLWVEQQEGVEVPISNMTKDRT